MQEGLVNRVISNLKDRRQRILNGEINCIPTRFRNFQRDFPGIEQGRYYLVSGATKAAKSQLANFLFLYTPILYAYEHPEQVRVKIFYFPLEETPENITLRFMSYLLYYLSGMKIRLSPTDLKSTTKERVLDLKILDILQSIEYQSILRFYEDNVTFLGDRNATGVWKVMNKYAEDHGKTYKKKVLATKNGVSQEIEMFDYYVPNDSNEYVLIIVDHASLLSLERGLSLRESINKLSEYMMILRNHYRYIPVVIQQQNQETMNLEAVKENNIMPTLSGLADTKATGKDCNIMLGITNPYSFSYPRFPVSPTGYDITKLKGYARFLNVALNRDGESNGLLALYFDGAVNYFVPLPPATNMVEMQKVYNLVAKNEAVN